MMQVICSCQCLSLTVPKKEYGHRQGSHSHYRWRGAGGTAQNSHLVAPRLCVVSVISRTGEAQSDGTLSHHLEAHVLAGLDGGARAGGALWESHRARPTSICLAAVVAVPVGVLFFAVVSAEGYVEGLVVPLGSLGCGVAAIACEIHQGVVVIG